MGRCLNLYWHRGGPGAILQYRKTQDGKKVPYPVCTNLYPEDRSVKAGVSFPNRDTTYTYDAGVTADVLAGLISNVDKMNANLNTQGVKHITIKWGSTSIVTLPTGARFTSQGKLVPLSGDCAGALRELKESNLLADVYLIQEALRAETLSVTLAKDASESASVNIDLFKALTLKPSAKATQKDTSSLDITESRYVASLPPVQITEFIPTNQLGAESAIIGGRSLSEEEWKTLNK